MESTSSIHIVRSLYHYPISTNDKPSITCRPRNSYDSLKSAHSNGTGYNSNASRGQSRLWMERSDPLMHQINNQLSARSSSSRGPLAAWGAFHSNFICVYQIAEFALVPVLHAESLRVVFAVHLQNYLSKILSLRIPWVKGLGVEYIVQ